jgi:DNA-binding HxlR family transcriptional regulator
MPDISKQTLVNQLRELEEDEIIERSIFAETPPRVEYRVTAYGASLMPVIEVMQEWGLKDLKKRKISY